MEAQGEKISMISRGSSRKEEVEDSRSFGGVVDDL